MSTVLLIESDERLQRFWQAALTDEGFQVMTAATPDEAKQIAAQEPPDLVFLGTGLDGTKGVATVEALRQMREDLLVVAPSNAEQVRQELDAMESQSAIATRSSIKVDQVKIAITDALELQRLKQEKRRVLERAQRHFRFEQIVGVSQQTEALRTSIAQAIQADPATVLITGETGTGKELVAKAIHYNSRRSDQPFMVVECAAVPATLLESELFGYEAGAFTDAKTSKKGLLEVAEGGTVFLDEIGDLEPSIQAKLLRVLEEKRFRRLGGTKDYVVDVRFLAATNRHLEAFIKEGRFRQDLYFRLNVFPIGLSPLRERKEDLLPLAKHFIEQFNREFHKQINGLSFAAQARLMSYEWPGNVRELRNVIERSVILEPGELILPQMLSLGGVGWPEVEEIRLPPGGIALEEVEKKLVQEALERVGGNQTEAAKLLKISRFALRTRMKKYKLC